MSNLRAIKKRIQSVKNTRQITRAMKMVSGAKFRRAEERVRHFEPYADRFNQATAAILNREEALTHPLLREGISQAPPLVVLVAADRGLCGAFNANVFKAATYHLEDQGIDPADVVFYAVGRKAREFVQRRKWTLFGDLTPVPEPPTPDTICEISAKLSEAFLAGVVGSVTIVYNHFLNALTQRVQTRQLLPLELPAPEQSASLTPPLAEPQAPDLLMELLPRILDLNIERIMLDSLAGEHGARMTAMDSASSNAEDMIDTLTLTYNRARQASITSELLDIINGKNATE